jgi:hypothetical protein
VRVTDSLNVRVGGNLAEGNHDVGIVFDALMDGTREIQVLDNVSRNNGGYGIEISRVAGGVVHGNRSSDNAHTEPVHVTVSERVRTIQ